MRCYTEPIKHKTNTEPPQGTSSYVVSSIASTTIIGSTSKVPIAPHSLLCLPVISSQGQSHAGAAFSDD